MSIYVSWSIKGALQTDHLKDIFQHFESLAMSGVGTDGLAARDHLMADKVDAVYLLFVEIRSLSSSCHLSKIYFIF